jgi:hypothetical protein
VSSSCIGVSADGLHEVQCVSESVNDSLVLLTQC